ncbi:MAG TPA: APC family permease [Dermatophilaceae bacterium]|nr:APC family permease [Dermatophilaceae bacterium]
MTNQHPAGEAEAVALHRRSLGVADIVFFVVAASAPLTVVAGGVPTSYAVTTLLGIPLIYVIIAVILLVFAVGYAAMSRHVANAGAFYTYVSKGLGQAWGVAAALVALVAYNAMQVGIFGLYGFAASAALQQFLGIEVAWWVPVLVTIVVIGVLGSLQVDLNARVLALFLILETVVVLVFDIAGVLKPAEGLTVQPFLPSALSGGAIGAALCFVTASFVGFESAAIYGEECRDPRKTVARATYTAVALIGVFYAFSAWATSMAVGDSQIIAKSQELTAGLLFQYAAQNVGGWFADVATVLFVTSLFAALLSFHNAVARYFFSLGREHVLPRGLARVSPRTGAPFAGSLAQSAIAAAVVLLFAVTGKDPVLSLFAWLTNLGALGVIFLMALTSVSVVAYLRRHREVSEATPAHEGSAALAAIALFVVFVLAVGNFSALLGSSPDDPLRWILPGLVIAAAVVGLGYAAYLRTARPSVYAMVGRGGDDAE